MARVDHFRLTRRVVSSVEFPYGLIVELLKVFHHGMACRMKSNVACLRLALKLNFDLQMDLGVQTAIYHVGVA